MGEDRVWVIGGGYDLASSRAQIEQNVLWAVGTLRALPGDRTVEVYFTDGDDRGRDVTEWHRPEETPEALHPLARVMGNAVENGDLYRNHGIPGVVATTEVGALVPALASSLAALAPGDRLLLVFSGHGTLDPDDAARNAVGLWHHTTLSVAELGQLLDRAAPGVTVRLVLTQCFSGAFARLARPDGSRCGFMAEAENRESEGCLASVEPADYRDYATYFFAALSGRMRDGSPTALPADRDGNGQVSLGEAHRFAMRVARSADLPRSTSEAFLLEWAPWYVGWARWLFPFETTSEHATLARELMRDEGLVDAPALRERRRIVQREREALEQERAALEQAAEEVRITLEGHVLRYWPEIAAPWTVAYVEFLDGQLEAAQRYILEHPLYPTLRGQQDDLQELEARLLEKERALALLERIEHLIWLARLRTLFDRLASDSDRGAYAALVACENSPP